MMSIFRLSLGCTTTESLINTFWTLVVLNVRETKQDSERDGGMTGVHVRR